MQMFHYNYVKFAFKLFQKYATPAMMIEFIVLLFVTVGGCYDSKSAFYPCHCLRIQLTVVTVNRVSTSSWKMK